MQASFEEKPVNSRASCFVAYPSQPDSLAESVEQSIEQIKKGGMVSIDGWRSLSVSGKFIMMTICEDIDKKDIFICDLTTLNHNVLFELGYAIAKNKRVLILLNPGIQRAKEDYEKFKLLTTVGYSPYTNSREIVDAFYKEQPYEDLEHTIYKHAIESVISFPGKPTLLYLKSGIETEASVKLSRKVAKMEIPVIVDDPTEVRIQTLSWYAQEVHKAQAVVVHFLSLAHSGWRLHNAKNSFVSGLAYGFAKHLLMLAHDPYSSPIDYRDLLKIHRTAAECDKCASTWLEGIARNYLSRKEETQEYAEKLRKYSELQGVALGSPVAEQESEDLLSYFVPTSAYREALEAKSSIFVGRRGSGKTAILYKLADEIGSDPRNHICIIKPIGYQLEGILEMLQQALATSERGYLVESLWKFLIYTEIARSYFEELSSKPDYYQADETEHDLMCFVEENELIILPDFSIRLDSAVSELRKVGDLDTVHKQRARISELLHAKIIARLRLVLGRALEKKQKAMILIDNLDKAWKPREDLPTLCDLLFGLLSVSNRISQDFRKADNRRTPVNLGLVIFLRSDIFSRVMMYAREKDKINYSRIAWDDPELLLRVLEERFLVSTRTVETPSQVWTRYFCPSVKGVETRKFLVASILPRPRDLIYLAKTAIEQAVNRRHEIVCEEDILEARKRYSQYALDSIVVEDSIKIETLEELLYEFVGVSEIITEYEVLRAMNNCGISQSKYGDVINLLCDLGFLGREVGVDRFEFLKNEDESIKFQAMARKTKNTRTDGQERFRINVPFHAYLEIHLV